MYLVKESFANNSINASRGEIVEIKDKKLVSSLLEAGYIESISEKEISSKEKDKQIENLNKQIAEKDSEILFLNDKVTELEKENQELKEILNDFDKIPSNENSDNNESSEDNKNLDNEDNNEPSEDNENLDNKDNIKENDEKDKNPKITVNKE